MVKLFRPSHSFSSSSSSLSSRSSTSSAFFANLNDSPSSQSDFTPFHSPLAERPPSKGTLKSLNNSEPASEDIDATPRLPFSQPAALPVHGSLIQEEPGYESDCDSEHVDPAAHPRRANFLRVRVSKVPKQGLEVSTSKSRRSGSVCRSSRPGPISLVNVPSFLPPAPTPAGYHLGVGLGLPSSHFLRSPGAFDSPSLVDVPITTAGTLSPCHLTIENSLSAARPYPQKPNLRPLIVDGLPSPMAMLPCLVDNTTSQDYGRNSLPFAPTVVPYGSPSSHLKTGPSPQPPISVDTQSRSPSPASRHPGVVVQPLYLGDLIEPATTDVPRPLRAHSAETTSQCSSIAPRSPIYSLKSDRVPDLGPTFLEQEPDGELLSLAGTDDAFSLPASSSFALSQCLSHQPHQQQDSAVVADRLIGSAFLLIANQANTPSPS